MSVCVQYPSAGCIVEYLEGNAVQIALVTEESGGKLRLLLPNRRETRLTTSRLLPWAGPALGSVPGKDGSARLLEQHRARREELAAKKAELDAKLAELRKTNFIHARIAAAYPHLSEGEHNGENFRKLRDYIEQKRAEKKGKK